MNDDSKLQQLFQLLRWCGAAMIVAAAGTFLVQSWDSAGDVKRYLALLGTTALLPAVAYVCGIGLKEGRSARVLILTFLGLLPIHAALLGGFVLSQFGTTGASIASVAQWVAPSRTSATLLVLGAAAVLMPLAWASFRVLSRPHARWLTTASAVSHGLLLIPSRSPEAAALAILPMLGIAFWCARRMKPDTLEAKLAVGSLLGPALVIMARQVLFYDVTTAFWAMVMALCASALLAMGRKSADVTIERLALIPTILGMGALADALSMHLSPETQCLSYGLATGAVLLAMGWSSKRSKRFFVLSAMVLNAMTPAVVLVFATSPWAALQLLALGLGFLSYGFVERRGFAIYAGATLAVSGFVAELAYAVDSFEPGGWLALAGLGVVLVGATAWLERRARAVRSNASTVKVSSPCAPELSGWQSNPAHEVAECPKSLSKVDSSRVARGVLSQ